MLFLVFEISFSQSETTQTFEEHQAMFSEIDVSKITTGILYDRVLPFSGIEKFDGNDKNVVCTQSNWKQIYFELQNASYNRDTVNTHDLDFIFGRKNRFTNGKLIPIYLLNYEYNKIKKNAFDDNLLIVQNNKIIENPKQNKNPYTEKKVFVAAPYKNHTYYGNDFAFTFNRNFLYTNTDEQINEIWADFDDGFGVRKVKKDSEIFINYAEIGEKIITVKVITHNNDTLTTKFTFTVKAKTIPDYTITRFETDETTGRVRCFCLGGYYYIPCVYSGECEGEVLEEHLCKKGGSLYHFKSPVTPDKMEKTILIVEGFDLMDNYFAEQLYDVFNKQKLADCLLNNNIDIFIANYDLPRDNIANNAIYIENVIDYINEIKGNKTELVIAGGSMGGLVSRYALTTMEQAEKDTQTRLWISFDSPQKGANIPLGVQYWLKELYDWQQEAGDLISKLRDKAAKQMLIYHFDDYPNTASERNDFVKNLNNLGYPQTSRNVAITNGASDGTGQGYSAGSKILELRHNTWLTRKRILTAWAVPDGGTDYIIAQRKLGNSIKFEKKVSNTLPLDAAPGGFRSTMHEIADNDDLGSFSTLTAFHNNHAFIPAISSLALDVDDYYYNIFNDIDILDKTPFDEVYFPKENDDRHINQPHVWVSYETALNILNEFFPEDIVLGNNNPDWKTGEVQATNSIRLTQGFHVSASDKFHTYIADYSNDLEPENWTPLDNKSPNNTKNKISSLEPLSQKNITIYPNPAKGIFTINFTDSKFKNNEENYKLYVTDITGKIVYSKNNINRHSFNIDISKEKTGIYIVKIITTNKVFTHKIIKQ